MPATTRISIVQLYVRRDQMMANLRSIRSFDASVGLLSPEDRVRYFGEPEQAEQARVATRASRVSVLAAAALVAVAACDAAPVGFTAPPAAGITSAASTDAPPAQPGTTSDEADAPDATSTTGTGSTTGEPSTTTAAVDATTTSGGDDTTGEPDPSTTGADTTTADLSTGEASTGTGDASTGADTSSTSTGGDTTGDESTSTSTSTAGDEGTSTGEPPPPIELPPECLSYTSLVDANRNVDFGIYGPKTCDAPSLAAGWYRFEGKAGVQMPTAPPPIYSCGTHAPGWMSGGPHPTVADGAVERTACYHWDNDGDGPLPDKPCWVSMPMQVRDCGGFFVYHLAPSPACTTRFCGEDV